MRLLPMLTLARLVAMRRVTDAARRRCGRRGRLGSELRGRSEKLGIDLYIELASSSVGIVCGVAADGAGARGTCGALSVGGVDVLSGAVIGRRRGCAWMAAIGGWSAGWRSPACEGVEAGARA